MKNIQNFVWFAYSIVNSKYIESQQTIFLSTKKKKEKILRELSHKEHTQRLVWNGGISSETFYSE